MPTKRTSRAKTKKASRATTKKKPSKKKPSKKKPSKKTTSKKTTSKKAAVVKKRAASNKKKTASSARGAAAKKKTSTAPKKRTAAGRSSAGGPAATNLAPRPPAAPPDDAFVLSLVREAIPSIGREGRFAPADVFVSAIYDRIGRESGMDLPQFKQWLVRQNRDGNLLLKRADLIGAMDGRLVAASEISDRGATFHFVKDPAREHEYAWS